MPMFKCRVVEEVTAHIDFDIEADTPEQAAKIAHDRWVEEGIGQLEESVDERYVEVNGEVVEHDPEVEG